MIIEITWVHVSGIVAVIIVPTVMGYLRSRDRTVKLQETQQQQKEVLNNMQEHCGQQHRHCDARLKDIHAQINEKVDKHQFNTLCNDVRDTNKKVDRVLEILVTWNQK